MVVKISLEIDGLPANSPSSFLSENHFQNRSFFRYRYNPILFPGLRLCADAGLMRSTIRGNIDAVRIGYIILEQTVCKKNKIK